MNRRGFLKALSGLLASSALPTLEPFGFRQALRDLSADAATQDAALIRLINNRLNAATIAMMDSISLAIYTNAPGDSKIVGLESLL